MMKKWQDIAKHPTYIAVFNFGLGLAVAIQRYLLKDFNNFLIYRSSVQHFFAKQPLYEAFPSEYKGFFVYNPTFPVLFMPYAYLPLPLGLLAWSLTLVLAFYYAIRLLPIKREFVVFIYFFSLIGLVTAMQNLDTAPLVAACIIATFVYAEREDYFRATFFPSIGFFVKGYVAAGASFLMLKKLKIRVIPYVIFWVLLFFALPLIRYSWQELIELYHQWQASYASDRINHTGISVMGLFRDGLHFPLSVLWIQVMALLLLVATMIVISLRKNYAKVKFYFLSYILIWVVIFNHLAETSTYVIALPGIALWYLISKRTLMDKWLLRITFFLTVLGGSALIPAVIREGFIEKYALQALGPSLIFALLQYYLFFNAAPGRPESLRRRTT